MPMIASGSASLPRMRMSPLAHRKRFTSETSSVTTGIAFAAAVAAIAASPVRTMGPFAPSTSTVSTVNPAFTWSPLNKRSLEACRPFKKVPALDPRSASSQRSEEQVTLKCRLERVASKARQQSDFAVRPKTSVCPCTCFDELRNGDHRIRNGNDFNLVRLELSGHKLQDGRVVVNVQDSPRSFHVAIFLSASQLGFILSSRSSCLQDPTALFQFRILGGALSAGTR